MLNKGVIFDLDGTLWDSTESAVVAWNEILDTYEEIDYQISVETMRKNSGKIINDIAKLFFYNISEERGIEIIKECCLQEQKYLTKNGGILYPDIECVLKELKKNYKLFIVSNCQHGYLETFFNYHKLDKYFDDFESFGRTGKLKGENIKAIIERNNLAKAVYVGDTQGDYDAAMLAKIPFIHAKYGFGKIEDDVPMAYNTIDIIELVEKLL